MGLGLRALGREAWLVAVGAVVAAARRAALWPAWAVLGLVLFQAAARALSASPLDPGAPLGGALAALGSARVLSLVAGLWLAGTLLGAALRVAWLAGALPTLGAAMAGAPPGPRFAAGVAFGFPRVLAAAALALVAEVAAAGFAWALALAALRVTVDAAAEGGSPLLAGAVALALTLAVAVPVAIGAVADAAVARAGVLGEGPATAFAGATRRFLARPGTFVLAALGFGLAGAFVPAAVESMGGVMAGLAASVDPLVILGPNLMAAAAAVFVAAALDLWWLGTASALACAEER
jgi:hypothetical protein